MHGLSSVIESHEKQGLEVFPFSISIQEWSPRSLYWAQRLKVRLCKKLARQGVNSTFNWFYPMVDFIPLTILCSSSGGENWLFLSSAFCWAFSQPQLPPLSLCCQVLPWLDPFPCSILSPMSMSFTVTHLPRSQHYCHQIGNLLPNTYVTPVGVL